MGLVYIPTYKIKTVGKSTIFPWMLLGYMFFWTVLHMFLFETSRFYVALVKWLDLQYLGDEPLATSSDFGGF